MNMDAQDMARRNDRSTQAADWLLRLAHPSVSAVEINEWMNWCDESPENKAEFTRMQALWCKSGALQERPVDATEIAADQYRGDVSVDEWRRQDTPSQSISPAAAAIPSPRAIRSRPRRWVSGALAAAGIATIAVLASLWITDYPLPGSRRDLTIETTTGVNRDVVLPDGSAVTVAAGSRLSTRFTANRRQVFLQAGEAYFRVRKDAQRPFVVDALDATVTAVGTAFNVRAEQGFVRVAVTEGAVDVDRAHKRQHEARRAQDGRPRSSGGEGSVRQADTQGVQPPTAESMRIRLLAGHQVTLAHNSPEPIVISVDADLATAWVFGTLRFVDEPLSSVVAAVNRYASAPVTLESDELGSYRYTGTVVTDRVDEWLRGLSNVFPVTVSEQPGRGVLVEAGSAPEG